MATKTVVAAPSSFEVKVWNAVNGRKTYIVSAATFLYALVVDGWLNGNWNTAVSMVFGSGGLATLRHAIAKG